MKGRGSPGGCHTIYICLLTRRPKMVPGDFVRNKARAGRGKWTDDRLS